MDDTEKPEGAEGAEGDLEERKFYRAEQEAGFAESAPTDTPQTRHPAYRLAFRDTEFLLRDELRPVRFQLELLKPEMLLDEARVGSMLVMYGSARIPPPEAVATALEGAKYLPVGDLAAAAKDVIASTETLYIPTNYQRIWADSLTISGTLLVNGKAVIQ